MFRVSIDDGPIISLDSNHPDKMADLEWQEAEDVSIWQAKILGLPGLFGSIIRDFAAPSDLVFALRYAEIPFQILEGAEILDIPRPPLPEGAVY